MAPPVAARPAPPPASSPGDAGRRSGPGALIVFGLLATLGLHGLLLVGVMVGRANAARVHRPQEFGQLVEVQAVKFGKPRDLSFLPHKAAPPTPKPRPKIALTEDEHALPSLKNPELPQAPVEDDPLKRVHKFDDPTADPANTGSAVEEGDENGLRGGTASVSKGPVYLQHLVAAVQNAWNVPPSFTDAQMRRLKPTACFHIDADGKIVEFHISEPSGNDRYDALLLDAFASIKQFDPPTDERITPGGPTVKQAVTGDGVCLIFQKTKDQ